MADAGPASPLLDGVSAILGSVSCGRVCTVSMRPGKGVENCVNAKDIVAGMAARAQLDVTGSMRNGFRKLCATVGTGGASQIGRSPTRIGLAAGESSFTAIVAANDMQALGCYDALAVG
jgi:hypothetical protein